MENLIPCPLPATYANADDTTWIDDQLTKVREYCGYSDVETDENYVSNDDLWKLVHSSINIISRKNCWAGGCGKTFIKCDRKEKIDIDVASCPSCDQNVIEIEPDYIPFCGVNKLTLIIKQKTVKKVHLQDPDQYWDEDCDVFRFCINDAVWLDEDDNVTNISPPDGNCCSCTYQVIFDYKAGYEELPECILDAICKLMQLAELEDNDPSAMEMCKSMETVGIGAQLQEYRRGDKWYRWRYSEFTLNVVYNKLYIEAKVGDLFQISRCGNEKPFVATRISCL